ncbi:MAG TPA: hypothetical protein VHC18_20845, partial [Amycolatopsis sp.]|nr:hypothetical protein [Amycolatopsis sp.]
SSTRNYGVWVQSGGREHVLEDSALGEQQRQAIGARMSAMLRQEWHSLGVGMGYRYDSSPIVVPDGTPPTPDDASEYVPTARPGHRAPHAWLAEGRSILELFGEGFTLLRFGADAPEAGMLVRAAERAGLPLSVETVEQPDIAKLYERRLVLVRPDGMVAWRGDSLPADARSLVDLVRGAAEGNG